VNQPSVAHMASAETDTGTTQDYQQKAVHGMMKLI
jgi:hypothetical protein